ncbi:U-box domain-containing protein 28 [Morella rubra]|uniref:U-box domain-containing protein n=1 Tax=Morella rubra TaxID=262757 RepID=A0A6A1W7J7_9ROSI|nr:U-box domain-containing protein 28 [Morella rubra]
MTPLLLLSALSAFLTIWQKMGRQELFITVPSLFRCPISMEVMRSPVSLCTGVTYDRSSIQHWLESGHDTCPATMQVLPSKHLVPNLTLHRLINLWLLEHHSSQSSPKPSTQQIQVYIEKFDDENSEVDLRDYLAKIVDFAKVRNQNRRFLADFDGFVEVIVGVLCKRAEMEVLELIIRILDLLISQHGVKERVHSLIFRSNYQNFFPSICFVLRNGSLSSKRESARILESLAHDAESKRRILEQEDLLSMLLHLVSSDNDPDLHDAVLSCLIAVSRSRSAKAELVRFGVVLVLSERLLDPNTKLSIAEKCLKLLSIASTCAEGRSAISENPKCAAALVGGLMKAGTEDAVAVLWGMCCVHGDRKVRDVVIKCNGVTKILLVMQSDCEGNVRSMCGELVKVLRDGCKSGGGLGLGRYETKTAHIMPC